jgi:hypothetical protein
VDLFLKGQEISVLPNIYTRSGTNSASYSIGTGGLSPRIRWPRCETDYCPLYSAKVKYEWSYNYLKYEDLILEIQHMWNVKAW